MKYIILDAPDGEAPILFPRGFMHRYVASLFAPMRVISAGFISDEAGGLHCHGHSTGLKLHARPERDTMLVQAALDGAYRGQN